MAQTTSEAVEHISPFVRLTTDRLALRVPRATDAASVYSYARDPDVTRYLSWPTHHSLSDTRAFLAAAAVSWARGTDYPYIIEHKATAQVLGGSGLTPMPDATWRLGYVLHPRAWGNGYATEAVLGQVRMAFEELAARRVEALVHPDNKGSMRVLEKSGFVQESLAPRCGILPNLFAKDAGPEAESTPSGKAPDVWTYVIDRRS